MRSESAGRDFRLFWRLVFASMSWAVVYPCRSDKTIHGCLSHHSCSYPKLTMDSRPWLRCSFFDHFDHIRTKNASLSASFIFRFDDNPFVVEIDKDAVGDRSLRVGMAWQCFVYWTTSSFDMLAALPLARTLLLRRVNRPAQWAVKLIGRLVNRSEQLHTCRQVPQRGVDWV